tara:strand:+ start:189 stop:566 length:378 start_codon:yes stop_codon:yes gene_type:complete
MLFSSTVISQPLVILEYSNSNDDKTKNSNNEDYSSYYKVKKNDTLSKIIQKHYGNKGLNFTFVQAAILHKNKNAFVRSNPNFMYAKKNLYLPSINEIKDLVYKDKKKLSKMKDASINQEIYFFGN